ncbi:unnamed protein product, partial [Urochloa humidicola]
VKEARVAVDEAQKLLQQRLEQANRIRRGIGLAELTVIDGEPYFDPEA